MGRLAGRVALITGAGAGIGRGIALRFAREGARIAIAERNAATGEQTARDVEALGAEALFIETDVAQKQQVERAVAQTVVRFGTVHILVNNAWAGRPMSRIERASDDAMRSGFEVGPMAALHAMQACFPHMKAQRYGRVVSLASLNGVNAHMFTVDYNAAKEAIRAITRTAAREWAELGITCNVVCPAAESEAMQRLRARDPRLIEGAAATLPMKRFGDPEEDIAPVVLFLATEDSRYVTGNTLFADGGSHINGASWSPSPPD
jgi:NAD(P)-dependent dehydrogenase (short-subunit alcohol dehydrogenase family)